MAFTTSHDFTRYRHYSTNRRTRGIRIWTRCRNRNINGTSLQTSSKRRTTPPLRGLASFAQDSDGDECESYQTRNSDRRVLLKISGEALRGEEGFGIDAEILRRIACEIRTSHDHGVQIAVVVGGGNFFRGADAFAGIDRATADHVGMLATTMNAICLQAVLENLDVPTRLQTAIEIKEVAEPFIRRRAIRHLEKRRVVIFGAGTGNPFFSTDMAAALRAAEISAHELLKATKVEGIFASDPTISPEAELLPSLTYDRALHDHLEVMDQTAVSLCRDQCIPIRVFSLYEKGNIFRAIIGEDVGSVMRSEEDLIRKNGNEQTQQFYETTNSVVIE